MSITTLQRILATCPQLKRLKLSYSIITPSDDLQLQQQLPQLETLDLDHTALPEETLQSPLNNCLKLKTLNLGGYKHSIDNLQLNEQACTALEKICLNSASIGAQSLAALLKKAQNLKALDLSEYQDRSSYGFLDLVLDKNSLPKLETLNLKLCRISVKSTQTLLEASPNLNELTLSFYDDFVEDLHLTKGSLAKLEKIVLGEGHYISPANIQTLREAAPHAIWIGLDRIRKRPFTSSDHLTMNH